MKRIPFNNQGITLVELMISLVLGVVLSLACIQAFLTTKQVFIKLNALARIQENARVASIVLGEAVEASGTIGCNRFKEDNILLMEPSIAEDLLLLPRSSITGLCYEEATKIQLLSKQVIARLKPHNDIFILKTVNKLKPIYNIDTKLNAVLLNSYLEIPKGKIISISDCDLSVFTKVSDVQHHKGKTIVSVAHHLEDHAFAKNALFGELSSQLYYIGNTQRFNAGGHPIDALYMTDLNDRTLELIEGVEQMKVEYALGEDLTFVSAQNVKNWLDVRKLRVSLLLTSIEDVSNELLKQWWHFEWAVKGLA